MNSSVTEQFIEQSPIDKPVNKLVMKMRSRAVKRPKCRSKFIVMSGGASVLLFIIVGYFVSTGFFTENEEGNYNGECLHYVCASHSLLRKNLPLRSSIFYLAVRNSPNVWWIQWQAMSVVSSEWWQIRFFRHFKGISWLMDPTARSPTWIHSPKKQWKFSNEKSSKLAQRIASWHLLSYRRKIMRESSFTTS